MNASGSKKVRIGYFLYTCKGHHQGHKVIDLDVIWKGFISYGACHNEVSLSQSSKVMTEVKFVVFATGTQTDRRKLDALEFHSGGIITNRQTDDPMKYWAVGIPVKGLSK